MGLSEAPVTTIIQGFGGHMWRDGWRADPWNPGWLRETASRVTDLRKWKGPQRGQCCYDGGTTVGELEGEG